MAEILETSSTYLMLFFKTLFNSFIIGIEVCPPQVIKFILFGILFLLIYGTKNWPIFDGVRFTKYLFLIFDLIFFIIKLFDFADVASKINLHSLIFFRTPFIPFEE